MVTTLEALQDAKETIEHLFKGDVAVWSLGGSARARATLGKIEQAIAQEQASQTASANPVVSQDVVETADKDCDTCNNRYKRMHQEPCFSCHGYTNWEPKP